MKDWTLRTAVVIAAITTAGCTQQQPGAPAAPSPGEKRTIAVVPKGTAHPFWKTVHAGAAKAAEEMDVAINWIGPEQEDDRKQQIDVVQNMVARGVNAIVLAPLDDTALAPPVETAVKRNIPVVIIDSALKSEYHSTFVATDNREGGRLGAKRLGEVMGGTGKALLLRYNPGSASTRNREEGFLEELQHSFPQIELVSSDQYAGVTKQSAMEASQNLLNKYGDDLQGIFCPNESSAFGMLRALENSGLAGKIRFVGFDASEALIQGLRDGSVHGLVAQDPFDMGYRGVQAAVQALEGKSLEKRIATRLAVVTVDNLDTPEIKALISPELSGM